MADELPATGSIPENLADDVPSDVDFNALMARSQAQLVHLGGMAFQANADMDQKLRQFGLSKEPAQ